MNDFDDEIIDLEDEELPDTEIPVEEEIINQNDSYNTPSNNNQKSSTRQKMDDLNQSITKSYLKKSGVPEPFANQAAKHPEKFAPMTSSPLTKKKSNNAKDRIANAIDKGKNKFPNINNKSKTNEENPNTNEKKTNSPNISKSNTQSNTGGSFFSTLISGSSNGNETGSLANLFLKGKAKKIKWIFIGVAIGFLFLCLLIVLITGAKAPNNEFYNNTGNYVVSDSMSDDELIEQLRFYGYCEDLNDCKEKGIYSIMTKMKSTYNRYKSSKGVAIDTALIFETLNFYKNNEDSFDVYYNSQVPQQDESLLSKFTNFLKRITGYNEANSDIEKLAEAQVEEVKETCNETDANGNKRKVTRTYYQRSYDKYTSYLMYGDSSSHPNYMGKPVEKNNEVCEGKKDDDINSYYSQHYGGSESDTNTPNLNGNTTGEQVVNYALQFVGNPYVWGGTSLTGGIDCSGFTMKVYENFGVSLPHSSSAQRNAEAYGGTSIGTDISQALPGDLILYNGHVAIYMGNNQIVHASNSRPYPAGGIKVSNNASYRPIVAIARYWR